MRLGAANVSREEPQVKSERTVEPGEFFVRYSGKSAAPQLARLLFC
jgi:hypothetical protein